MDLIESMLYPPSDDEEQRALAQNLRGRKGAADFFALSTVGNIAKAAKDEQQNVMQGAQRSGILKNALSQRQDDAEQDILQRDFDAEQQRLDNVAAMERVEERGKYAGSGGGPSTTYKGKERWIDENGNDVVVQYSNGMAYRTMGGQPVPIQPGEMDNWQFAGSPMSEGKFADLVADIPETVGDQMDLVDAVEELDRLMKPYSEQAGARVRMEDVPGRGDISGQRNLLGRSMRVLERFGGQEDSNSIYSAGERLRNTLARNDVGKSQTITEIQNQLRESGGQLLDDPQVFFENIDLVKKTIRNVLAQRSAGMDPTAKAAYMQQFERIVGDRDVPNPMTWEPEILTYSSKTRDDPVKLGNNRWSTSSKAPAKEFDPAKQARLEELQRKQAQENAND